MKELYQGIENYALELCAEGRLSIGKCAELLNKSIWEIQDMAKQRRIILGVDEDQAEKTFETTKKIAAIMKRV